MRIGWGSVHVRPPSTRFEEHRLDGQEASSQRVDREAFVRVLPPNGDEDDRAVGQGCREGSRVGVERRVGGGVADESAVGPRRPAIARANDREGAVARVEGRALAEDGDELTVR